MAVCIVVFDGSNVVPSIGSVPLGTTFQVVGTAPIQYSTVCPVRSPTDGRKVACFAAGFCVVATCAGAAPDGNATTSRAPATPSAATTARALLKRPRSPLT